MNKTSSQIQEALAREGKNKSKPQPSHSGEPARAETKHLNANSRKSPDHLQIMAVTRAQTPQRQSRGQGAVDERSPGTRRNRHILAAFWALNPFLGDLFFFFSATAPVP